MVDNVTGTPGGGSNKQIPHTLNVLELQELALRNSQSRA
jgi:hypothetical protein